MKNNAQIYLTEKNIRIWHKCLRYFTREKILFLLKEVSIELNNNLKNDTSCEECIKGKYAKDTLTSTF